MTGIERKITSVRPINHQASVADFEGYSAFDFRSPQPLPRWDGKGVNDHAGYVGQVLAIRNAVPTFYNVNNGTNNDKASPLLEDSPQSLEKWYEGQTAGFLSNLNDRLENFENLSPTQRESVINLSIGTTNTRIKEDLGALLSEKNGDSYRFPKLKAYLNGYTQEQVDQINTQLHEIRKRDNNAEPVNDPEYVATRQKRDALFTQGSAHGDAILKEIRENESKPGGALNDALKRYETITKKLHDEGVAIVVASGNEHKVNQVFASMENRSVSLDDETNLLSLGSNGKPNPNIILACASKGSDPSSLELADYSNRSDYCIVAPGTLPDAVDVNTGEKQSVDGTSFSAPFIAATLKNMQAVANPDLSLDDEIGILKATATPPKPDEVGAGYGYINPDKAIELARASNSFQLK